VRAARALPRLAWLVVLLAILGGCDAIRLAYDNADTFLHWRLSGYLQVHGKASDELNERIDDYMAWHRVRALPQYSRLSADAARRVAAGLSPGDLVWGYDALVAQATEGLHEAAVRIAPMLDRLTPEQLSHLEKRFAEDNRKFSKENRGSDKDRRNRRTKRTVERLEEWVGKLSKSQVERVRQFSERVPLYEELRDRDRKRIQTDVLAIVRSHEAQKRLPAYVDNWERGRDPAFAAANKIWRAELEKLLLDLDKTLTPEQRTRAVTRLRGFSEDFTALAMSAATHSR
jgi:hypothetical protein